MAEVKFTATKAETETIRKIIDRVVVELPWTRIGFRSSRQDLHMDIEAVHSNGCPLDLEKLLIAPAFDFAHDISGIRNCIDRSNGTLQRNFRPRCALPQAEVANG